MLQIFIQNGLKNINFFSFQGFFILTKEVWDKCVMSTTIREYSLQNITSLLIFLFSSGISIAAHSKDLLTIVIPLSCYRLWLHFICVFIYEYTQAFLHFYPKHETCICMTSSKIQRYIPLKKWPTLKTNLMYSEANTYVFKQSNFII